ncbi:MAG: TonB-dependent receptor [Paludibacteraceae bacterium]|nr:TonB-dependent receptor [Paludibacteraceae bacterium]
MKKTALFFCSLLTSISVSALTVSGKIMDGSSATPLDFVNVTLYKIGSSTPVVGGFSDANGIFKLEAPDGDYTFKATFVGYTEYSKNISKEKNSVRLGLITLKEDSKQIAEVEVVGQKSGMTLDIDKKVFNVEQSIIGEGASAAEILENIPSVEIDMEGNVSLRNSSSVEIWINGKPSGLSDTDRGQVLEMLPANAVKSVEIITNPSAKYNPEGNAGIINIVMKENQASGYFGNVSTGLNYQEGSPYPGGQLGFNINGSNGKWDYNFNTNVRFNRRDRNSYINRKDYAPEGDSFLLQNTRNDMERLNGFFRGGFTYHISELDEIGLTAFGMIGKNWNNRLIDYTELNSNKDTTMTRNRTTNSTGIMGFYNVTASYKHSFIKDTHYISADLNYTGNTMTSNSNYASKAFNPDHTPIPDLTVKELQTMKSPSNRVSGQVDYSNKLTEKHKIEAGLKADVNISDSKDQTFDSDTLKYNNPFYYREQIYAAYINYAGKFNWFSLQVGLRCEETITNTQSLVDGIRQTFDRNYFQPFPSVYMGFEINKTNTIQLNYTRRINRPRGRMLNSYIDRSDPANLSQGNPWLMPEFGNAVELNYLKTWEMHTLSVQMFYRYTENVIQRVSKLMDDGAMYNTFDNITYSQNAGAEIVAKNRLFHNYLDLTTSISAYYYQLGENKQYNIKRKDSFSWNAKINANVKIINNLSAQINAYYKSPETQAQGSIDHQYGMDLGLKANFLDKKLTLSFSVRDVLNSRWHSKRITESDNFYQESETTSCGRSYRLTLTYNFGNMKGKNKGKNRENLDEGFDMDDDF